MIIYIIIGIIAYLIGSINFSVLISKKMAGFDVREKGSGNGGTTNVLRTVGKKAAVYTLLGDVLKGVLAILIAFFIGKFAKCNPAILVQIAAFCVVVRTYFSNIFSIQRRKRSCYKFRNNFIIKLENWYDLFCFCNCINGSNKNGISSVQLLLQYYFQF